MSDTRVYFILNASSKAVKIGVADNVSARLSALQTGCVDQLTLLAQIPGDERFECDLHRHFAEYAIRGEWFRYEGRLAALIGLLPEMTQNAKRSRVRERKPLPRINREEHQKHWDAILATIRAEVLEIGVEKFAEVVKARCSDVVRAIYGNRGRHFSAKWFTYLLLMLPPERNAPILRLMAEPGGFEILTPQEAEERAATNAAANERMAQLWADVLEKFGPVQTAMIRKEFEQERAAEEARVLAERDRAFAARWMLPDEARP